MNLCTFPLVFVGYTPRMSMPFFVILKKIYRKIHCDQIVEWLEYQIEVIPSIKACLWGCCLCQFAKASVTKCHQLGSLNNRNYCLTVLEARRPTSGCWPGWFLLRASRERSVLSLSPWLSSWHSPVCVPVSKTSPLIGTPVKLDSGSTLL